LADEEDLCMQCPLLLVLIYKHALFEGVPKFSAIKITLALCCNFPPFASVVSRALIFELGWAEISVFGKKRSGRRDAVVVAVVVVFQILKFLLIVAARFRFGLKAK
jgi:hypothetical protein